MMKKNIMYLLVGIFFLSGNAGFKRGHLLAGVTSMSSEREIIAALNHLCGDYYHDLKQKQGGMTLRLRIVANFVLIAEEGQIKGKEYCLVKNIRKEDDRYALNCSKESLPEKYGNMIKKNAQNLNFIFLIEDDLGKIILKKSENEKEGALFYK